MNKDMKKYISSLFLVFLGIGLFSSCTDDEGTEIGSDSSPVVTVYQYETALPNSADNDATVRVAGNNKVSEVYYFAETTAAKTARGMSESDYADYVVANGTKITMSADAQTAGYVADFIVKGLIGDNTITVVGVNGNQKSSASTTFFGLDWVDVTTGTFMAQRKSGGVYGLSSIGFTTSSTTLQKCANKDGLYRLKDCYGAGYSMKFTTTGSKQTDGDGDFYNVRVASQNTGLTFGKYGALYVRDVALWQNDDSYVSNNQMYADNTCYIFNEYFVSAGRVSYGYDYFIPD
jgi:hypothetical protein